MTLTELSDQNLTEYLFNSLQDALAEYPLSIREETQVYVAHLALRYLNSDQLFIQQGQQRSLPTLAFLYRDALAAGSERERDALIRTLGDTALFLAACFPDVWRRRGLNRRYFLSMGENAFGFLASAKRANQFPFDELAAEFTGIATCLGKAVFPDRVQH
ncbi:MAG: hypothetical protein R3227_17490 [Reinekea sp.]|jgi:hypothetical protein|nr:hypothetical protein [Reinekea sp.]